MKPDLLWPALSIPAVALSGVLAFALPAAAQNTQDAKPPAPTDGAGTVKPASVGGVTVQAPRPESKLGQIPPDKKAELDQEAAKQEAWKRYRQSRPPLAEGTLGMAQDYPGLQTLLPQPDDAAH